MAVTVAEQVAAGHARLAALIAELTDEQAHADSALPGWSRGHVLTHLAELARAFVRQVEYALAGKVIEVYDGGRPARDAAIEAGAGRDAADLRAALLTANSDLERAWSGLTVADWARPVSYRDGTLLDTAYARWRETEIHNADLALGYRSTDFSVDFCSYLIDFLVARIPAGTRLTVIAEDTGFRRVLGVGSPVEVRGQLTDLAAWLAGRSTVRPLRTAGTVPELGPWP
ncbi:MAG TPA: maleylpyruvate isomerase family mycothiol-dependent enzyme [Pseudonocardiaceae bacterium]|nr:maleylpyruvate isomerase family mycothiol-dependent enzyme [Pseudonocardiaceae bacterium]